MLSLDSSGIGGGGGSAWFNGDGAPVPAFGEPNDYYLDDLTGDVWHKTFTVWEQVANIKGPHGNAGVSGTPGSVWRNADGAPSDTLGSDGDYYLNNINGSVYCKDAGHYTHVATIIGLQGPQGIQGNPGPQGPQGTPGTPGAAWRNGSGAPTGGLGINGDYYLDDDNGDVYFKSGGSYSVIANIEGPQGNQGIQGNPGTPGAAGAPGAVWRNGSGVPADSLGINGDYYLNDLNGDVYLRSAGHYSVVSNILGPTGATGATGFTGAPGPQGDPGQAGAAGADGADGNVLNFGGILTRDSATALKFAPKNGNKIKINGAIYDIPNAGIAGLGNTGVYVNGTAGQNLAANANYLVCAFNNSGIITGDFVTTLTHVPDTASGNAGVEVKSSDSTRTVIGLIRTNASSQFVDSAQYRFVRSWFNRKVARLRADFTSSVSAAPYVQIQEISPQSRVYWVNFAGEMVLLTMTGSVWSNYSSAFYTALGVDGVFDANLMSCISNYADGYARLLSGASNFEPSEGYHYGNFGSQATGNVTTTWSYCGIVGLILP